MPKEPFETISVLLDYQDLLYLARLLYTIDSDITLRSRLIPAKVHPSSASNWGRVNFRINYLLQWYNPKIKIGVLQPPKMALKSSRYVEAKKRKQSYVKKTK